MPGHIYSRNGIWWIKYSDHGRPHYESSKSRDQEKAEKLLRRRLTEVEDGTFVQHSQIRVVNLLDDLDEFYKRNRPKSYKDFCLPATKRLRLYWRQTKATKVTTAALQRYQDSRINEGGKPATINREMALLRRAYKLGLGSTPRKVSANAIPKFPMLKENNVRRGFLLKPDYDRLMSELPEELKAIATVAYHVGCRLGELLALRREQVLLEEKVIRLYSGETKNEEGRTLPIYGEMIGALEKQFEGLKAFPKCRFVFHRNGKQIKTFRRAWKLACDRAEISGLLFHDLRRSAVRNLRRAGVSETTAMKISGHRTRAVFDRYDIIDLKDLRDAGSKVEAYFAKPAQD